jgi:competence ComEA-like helix-hairpin-helix protein
MAESPAPSKILEFSRKELIATLFLITSLLIGIGTKYTIDYHWWLPETKVIDTNPESIRLKINLNRAEWYELIILPGIGEKRAKAIIEHRKNKGAFRTIEQLCEINGIGTKTVKKIKDLIYLVPTLQRGN